MIDRIGFRRIARDSGMTLNMPNRGQGWDRRRRGLLLAGGLLTLAAAPALHAQQLAVSSVSQPVVQAIPGGQGARLNAALSRLARDSRDVSALIDAGQASLDLGDVQAAIGFYQRADAISPGNGQVKGGLAAAYVQAEEPLSAIPLFEEAAKSGTLDPQRLADRALAYDLVGDSVTAQQYYRQALAAGPDDETVRRLALSQAISGDKRGMEATLAPLLQKQDKSSWRTRAFALAIVGQAEEAEAIARSTLPADMAGAIAAYLRFMPRLTPAQQAAAANLGRFPRAAEIGIDDPRFAQYARPRTVLATASQSLTPAGAPLGAKPDSRQTRREREQAAKAAAKLARNETRPVQIAAAAPPEPRPGRETVINPASVAMNTPPPAPVKVAAAAPPPPPAPIKVAAAPPPAPPPSQPAAKPAAGPGFGSLDTGGGQAVSSFDLRQVPPPTVQQAATPAPPPPVTQAPAPAPAVVQASVPVASPPPAPVKAPTPIARPAPAKANPAPPRPRQLEDVFADLTPPSRQAEAAAGAVDVRRIKPVRAEPAAAALKPCEPVPDPKAKGAKAAPKGKQPAVRVAKGGAATQCVEVKRPVAPSHPSRIWVQVATGRDRKALAFDWRRMVKDDAAVFGGRKGFTSAWGQTNRLLTGPFETEAAANAFMGKLKKAGVSGSFLWTSPAGQVVDAVAAGK